MGISEETTVVNRDIILTWLREDILQLRKWAKQSHTIKNPIRIQCYRASIHACNVMLQAMKDQEIDELAREIEEIKKSIEEWRNEGKKGLMKK